MVGIILWWDSRHLEGVIKGEDGKRYYFNSSVVKRIPPKSKIRDSQVVTFLQNIHIKHALCADAVLVLSMTQQNSLKAKIARLSEDVET